MVEIRSIKWTKPKKSDKGAIILHTNKQFNLFLWTKENLDEWMFMMNECIERLRTRKSILSNNILSSQSDEKQQQQLLCNQIICEDLYENTNGFIPKPSESTGIDNTEQARPIQRSETITKRCAGSNTQHLQDISNESVKQR